MADRFVGSVTLRGANGKTASVRYALQPATYAEAKTALDAIVNELVDVTDATVTQKNLTFVYGESGLVGGGDIFEKATVACHTNLDTEVSKYAVLNVPAPAIAIFLAAVGEGRDEVDIDNTDIKAYVAAVADNAFVSDGEEINTSLGAGGIKAGRRTLSAVKLG